VSNGEKQLVKGELKIFKEGEKKSPCNHVVEALFNYKVFIFICIFPLPAAMTP
jgi:hypothetical protein